MAKVPIERGIGSFSGLGVIFIDSMSMRIGFTVRMEATEAGSGECESDMFDVVTIRRFKLKYG